MLDKGILVCLDYGGFSFKTKTVKGDGYTSAFNETFSVPVRNGLNALDFEVWKEKRFAARKLIGSGCIDLHKVFTEGSDRRTCRFHARDGSKAGEIKLQMDCFGHTSKVPARTSEHPEEGEGSRRPMRPTYDYLTCSATTPAYPSVQSQNPCQWGLSATPQARYPVGPLHPIYYSRTPAAHVYQPSTPALSDRFNDMRYNGFRYPSLYD
ncbi:hypothetical protein KP509_24G074700 [Ceratopteris richardii]|nr:hypothetical protein KP509_24G074700 [Ceratopteris richardii]